ncbi:DUF397 domain-containing protein [Streptomyces sp. CS7]|uniref:DUF397 domain-containing protein n=1 Tax=Streptomyces sp. CS-7 TaxID=2906769 RepID=UPI0021B252A7|nr:DUF397 domain-containing protein [Streptomyces sp. CS-7]MCT6776072.1 DUF397 domain-containing protein [Streptomyces sp. CS-7]
MNGNAVLADASWFTSSYSNDQGGACVEGARLEGAMMAVRDSKDREAGTFVFPAASWGAFVGAVKQDTLS